VYFYNKILSDYVFNDSYDYIIFTGLTQTPNENPTYYYRLKDHKNFLSNTIFICQKSYLEKIDYFKTNLNKSK